MRGARRSVVLASMIVVAGCTHALPDPDSPGAQLYQARCGTCHPLHEPRCAHRGDVGDPGGEDARDDATARRPAAHRRRASGAARVSEGARDRRRRTVMKVRLSDTPAERVDADLVVLVVASDKLTRLRALKIAGPGRAPGARAGALHGRRGNVDVAPQRRTRRPAARDRRRRGEHVGERRRRLSARRRPDDRPGAGGARADGRRRVPRRADPPPDRAPRDLRRLRRGRCCSRRYGFTDLSSRPRPRRDRERDARRPGGPARPALRRAVRRGEILAEATNQARTWINEPAAVMTPATFAADAERVLTKAGLEVQVDGPAGLRKLGMGALLGVARGSAEEPRFLRVTYRPEAPRRREDGHCRRRATTRGARREGHHVRQRRALAQASRRRWST